MWSAARAGHITPRVRAHDIHIDRRWVDPRAGLDAVVKEKIPYLCRKSNHGRLARSLVY